MFHKRLLDKSDTDMQFEATPQASYFALTAFCKRLHWCGIYPVVTWIFSDRVHAITARR